MLKTLILAAVLLCGWSMATVASGLALNGVMVASDQAAVLQPSNAAVLPCREAERMPVNAVYKGKGKPRPKLSHPGAPVATIEPSRGGSVGIVF